MLIDKRSPHGGDVYTQPARLDFSANVNPAGMPPPVRQALEASAAQAAVYPDPYCTALRRGLSQAEGVPERWILCGNGAAELIYSFAYALPKDRPALVVSPAFSEYETACAAAGVPTERYLLREADGFSLTEAILALDLSRYAAVFLASPNNPTGIAVAPPLLRALARRGVRMLFDVCFLSLTDAPDRYELPALLAECPNVTALCAFTKSYAMAGVRLGYALSADGAFLSRMSEMAPCWNVSTPAQAAGAAALGCGGWLRASVREISAERRRLTEALAALGLAVWPGEANFLLLRAPRGLGDNLRARGILVRDCAGYAGLAPGFFRVAVRTRGENDELIQTIREVLP